MAYRMIHVSQLVLFDVSVTIGVCCAIGVPVATLRTATLNIIIIVITTIISCLNFRKILTFAIAQVFFSALL